MIFDHILPKHQFQSTARYIIGYRVLNPLDDITFLTSCLLANRCDEEVRYASLS